MTRVVVAVLTVVALTTGVRAEDRAGAADAFDRGRKQMKDGDYKAACASFELSLRLETTTGTLYNLGLCHEKVGKIASAWTELRQVSEDVSNQARAADAAKRVAELESRLTRFKVVVDPAPGLVVERDGVDITPSIGQAVPVDPRTYVFTAKAPGKKQVSVEVALAKEGETIDVNLPAFATDETPVTPISTGYPDQLALRPLTMPDGRLEVTAGSVASTSESQFEQSPIDAVAAARFGIQKFELGLVTSFHVRYPQATTTRPNPWQLVGGNVSYAIKPMLAARFEYDRFQPIGDLGGGSNLRGNLGDKFLLAPRVAFDGRAGFLFQQFNDGGGGTRNELILETHYALQAIATPKLSLEAAAELDLNLGGQLYDHTVSLGVGPRVLYAATHEIDVFAQIFLGLLPAVEGKSSSDFRSYALGLNWRR